MRPTRLAFLASHDREGPVSLPFNLEIDSSLHTAISSLFQSRSFHFHVWNSLLSFRALEMDKRAYVHVSVICLLQRAMLGQISSLCAGRFHFLRSIDLFT